MILSFSDKIPFQSETLITRRKKEWKDWIQSDKLQCQNADKASMLNNEFMYAPTLNNLYDNLLHNWCKSPPPPFQSTCTPPHPSSQTNSDFWLNEFFVIRLNAFCRGQLSDRGQKSNRKVNIISFTIERIQLVFYLLFFKAENAIVK
jgi:hypothetical protein